MPTTEEVKASAERLLSPIKIPSDDFNDLIDFAQQRNCDIKIVAESCLELLSRRPESVEELCKRVGIDISKVGRTSVAYLD